MTEFDEDPELLDIAKQINRARRPDRSGQVRRMTGTLRAWNPGTLQGVVELPGGQLVTNPPVMAALDAMSWAPGDEVILDLVAGSGGFAAPMIAGRVFRPGATNSGRVLDALRSRLAQEVSAEIFAARVKFVENDEPGTRTPPGDGTLGPYGDLTGTDPGPSVTVEVTSAGKMIVFVSCYISVSVYNNDQFNGPGGVASFVVEGPNGTVPSAGLGPTVISTGITDDNVETNHATQLGMQVSTAYFDVIEGLDPGSYTVKMVYAAIGSPQNSRPVLFDGRRLCVISF